jgi:3',5'-nucleoside bisphosphate phosphatase
MHIEIHTHTAEHSPCSHILAEELVLSIYKKEISGVIITDHHYLWTDEEILNLRARLDIQDDFLILSGQEVSTKDYGDVLVYGAYESISKGQSLTDLRKKYPEAALVWAHPYRSGQVPTVIELFNSNFDAIEILNPHQKEMENKRGISDWKRWGYTATSGSDIHKTSYSEFYPISLQSEIKDIHSLISSIKEGLCAPTMGKYIEA